MTTVYCTRCQKGHGVPVARLGPWLNGQRIQEVSLLCTNCSHAASQESLRAKKRITPAPMRPGGWTDLVNFLLRKGLA